MNHQASKEWVEVQRRSGFSEQQIRTQLINSGYNQAQIESLLASERGSHASSKIANAGFFKNPNFKLLIIVSGACLGLVTIVAIIGVIFGTDDEPQTPEV